jgi:hypothetical protein
LILEFSQQIEKPKLFPNKIDFSVSLWFLLKMTHQFGKLALLGFFLLYFFFFYFFLSFRFSNYTLRYLNSEVFALIFNFLLSILLLKVFLMCLLLDSWLIHFWELLLDILNRPFNIIVFKRIIINMVLIDMLQLFLPLLLSWLLSFLFKISSF